MSLWSAFAKRLDDERPLSELGELILRRREDHRQRGERVPSSAKCLNCGIAVGTTKAAADEAEKRGPPPVARVIYALAIIS
jgi:hypothetical protein